MFPFAIRHEDNPEIVRLRAVVMLQAALIRIVLRIVPDLLRQLTDADRRQLAELSQPLGWRVATEHLHGLVATSTLRRWYQHFVKPAIAKVKPKPRQRGGRKPISNVTKRLVVAIATSNFWGYRKIVGALAGLHITISASSVKRILKAHGIKPVSDRRVLKKTWRAFIAAHWSTLASIDFTCVPVLTLAGWKMFYVGVAMIVATRKVHMFLVTANPDAVVMQQVGRNLTMVDTGFLAHHGITHLIHDGGGELCKTGFDHVLASAGITYVRIPPHSPNCNPHIERFFRSLKDECLHRIWFVGDRGLVNVTQRYCHFYNHRRPHQGIGNQFISPDERLANTGTTIKRRSEIGGLLNFYHCSAA